MPTKEHASKEIPTLTHKQLINAYIEKKTDEILIPFTDKIETPIKSCEAVVKKNAFLQSTNTDKFVKKVMKYFNNEVVVMSANVFSSAYS